MRRVGTLSELLDGDRLNGEEAISVIAVDIPIGLTDGGPRECDVAARQLIGPRHSSVFPAPVRAVLDARDYAEACALGMAADGRKISQQTFHILPKIREVDVLLRSRPELADRVYEVHPEVSFAILNGNRPMQHNKRKLPGAQERIALLEPVFGESLAHGLAARTQLGCGADDVVDAFVALWTAERIACGEARAIPPSPPVDRYGLRMAMTA